MRDYLSNFIFFLRKSSSPWHVTKKIAEFMANADFSPLFEEEKWELKENEGFFAIREGSIVAFYLPQKKPKGATLLHSHSDSPMLKLKPYFQVKGVNCLNFLVETYGGLNLHSWFNRDLFLSGKISLENDTGKLEDFLVELDDLPFIIPQLAVHLEEKEKSINKQIELRPLVSLEEMKEGENILEQILRRRFSFKKLRNFELYCTPLEPPRFIGKTGEMIAAAKLDNLASSFAAAIALQEASRGEQLQMLIISDHEEIGSNSFSGALSSLLPECLERIALFYKMNREEFFAFKHHSLAISVDAAQGYNSNFPDKYDIDNTPFLGRGVTLKHTFEQHYA